MRTQGRQRRRAAAMDAAAPVAGAALARALAVAAILAGSLAAGLAGCGPRPGGSLAWRATCGADTAAVGDLVPVRIDGCWPAARQPAHLRWGLAGDSLLVVRADSLEVEAQAGWAARRYDFALIAPRAGRVTIPPAALVTASGETLAVTAPITLGVGGRVAPQAETALRPLAPLASLRGFPWWLIALSLALLAGAGVLWWLRRRRTVSAEAAEGPPPPPPAEEFRTALDALLGEDLAGRGRMRDFAQELSWILRRYLGRRWERPALEATRPEILQWLPGTELSVVEQQKLSAWLAETDAIKFAGRLPLLAAAQALVEGARAIVKRGEEIAEERARREAEAAAATTGTGFGGENGAASSPDDPGRPATGGAKGAAS